MKYVHSWKSTALPESLPEHANILGNFLAISLVTTHTHSRMGHYLFSYLLTWEVELIEILEIMPQMWQYVIFFSLKPTKVTSDFILNLLKKVVGGATTQKY